MNLWLRIIFWLFNQLRSYLKRQREARSEYLAERRRYIIGSVHRTCQDEQTYDDVSRMIMEMPIDVANDKPKPGHLSHPHLELLYMLHRLRVRPRRVRLPIR